MSGPLKPGEADPVLLDAAVCRIVGANLLGISRAGIAKCLPSALGAEYLDASIARVEATGGIELYMSNDAESVKVYVATHDDVASGLAVRPAPKLTKAQLMMLRQLDHAPWVIPGTRGTTARILREAGLIEANGASPPTHSITPAGRAALAGQS